MTLVHEVTGRTVHALDAAGHVRDWLAGPVWSGPCDDLETVTRADGDPWGENGRWTLTNGPDVAPLKIALYHRHPLLTDQPLPVPVADGRVQWRRSAGDPPDLGTWQRVHTGTDGLLDWSRFCFTPEYRHALAATVLEVDQAEYRELEVACTGPFVLFADGRPVLSRDEFDYMDPSRSRVRVRLSSGLTTIHLATWQVAFREVRHVASLRVHGLPVRVVLPDPAADEYRSRRAEQALDAVGVYPWASSDDRVTLTGSDGLALRVTLGGGSTRDVVLHGGSAEIALSDDTSTPGSAAVEDVASMLDTGELSLTISVPDPAAPVTRQLKVARLPSRHRDRAEGDPITWRRELLEHVAARRPSSARALARHAIDAAAPLDPADLEPALRMLAARADCADFEAVGLLHLLHRLPDAAWPPGTLDRVTEALTSFKYWIDQPGLDAMCYFTENHQLVWHTAETLAGELLPDAVFTSTGWTGREHATHGRELAEQWMRRRLSDGFSEFDSNAYLAIDSLALASWVEFAGNDDLRALAEALLDKILLSLASNSWRGVHGAAHGRSYVPTLRSSRFEETAPIMWLLWGQGSLNEAVLPATVLATARSYVLPPVVRRIAAEPPAEWDGRQVYRGTYRLHHDLLDRPYGSDLRVWRTPDAMLSSVQDYRAGLPGLQEHVWGATLGPEVQVFATHPAADTISSSARPNAWAGQRVLPRAHQYRDAVLVLHRFPPADWIARTHLWFPVPHLDEWTSCGSWLAGRVGDGYVAVSAAGGLQAETNGDEVNQCWWPRGDGRAYVATVGRRAVDGTFSEFVAALAEPEFAADPSGEPAVHWTTRAGRRLSVSWTGPFTVDSAVSPESDAHLDNPACRTAFGDRHMVANWGGEELRLDLAAGRRIAPAGATTAEARRGR